MSHQPKACVRRAACVVAAIGLILGSRAAESAERAGEAPPALERFVPTPEQLREADRARPERSGRAYKTQIAPSWLDDNTHFWYRNELRGGRREFILVNAAEGARRPAFDHQRLAAALREAGVADARADRLPIESLAFDQEVDAVEFRAGGKRWRWKCDSHELTEAPDRQDNREAAVPQDLPRASTRTGEETELTFVNRTGGEVELFWLDTRGQRRSYGKLAPGAERAQHTYAGHVWEVVNAAGQTLTVVQAEETSATAVLTGEPLSRRAPRRTFSPRRTARDRSPDGRWTALVRDHNVFLRSQDDGQEIQLSHDGRNGLAYGMLEWSPDSQTLVAYRIEPGEEKEVYLIESSPSGGGRARLHSRRYALPGDKFASHELNLFRIAERKQIKPEVEPIDFGRPRLRWRKDGRGFTYQKVDRGHQRFRLIEVDAQTGDARNLIDEQTNTFLWTAHTENVGLPLVTWLEMSDEILYASERDGWRHLYLIDASGEWSPRSASGETARGASGPPVEETVKSQITRGPWVVRGIEHIDEDNRQIWFRASGMNPDQDPYFLHYYRINFDGTGLTALTEGNGTHRVQFSPDRKYLIDTYSRVDCPPIHELRRADDGSLVCELERADISELEENGWAPPEVFSAKGRDGKTDIWGIICRPRDFDPTKKYPVIERIYAGPQSSYVPKSFSPARRFASLTDLGFIVVQIDGMGTAHRSKAFHDVCWKNLKDAGLPDRILWHQAVAAKYPSYDLERLGVYGVSAGGQNAAAAVLFHPEFYKVAVAGCGCHDNRLDKASWNEQWMGYPVGPHYAECSNIDNAWRLQGKLLLIVGEMDDNVPPESTLRFADALIKAGKDFDLLVVPSAGHGMGGAYGQRRMQDYFIRCLHGVEPPNRNAPPRKAAAYGAAP